MCELATIISAAVGTAISGALASLSVVDSYQQQRSLNAAIEAAYENDLQNARNRYAQQQMQLQEETLQASAQNRQERQEAQLDALRTEASSQAAMSSLNVAGNTASRAVTVGGTATARSDATYAAQREGIMAEHLIRGLGIKQEYEGAVDYAAQKAKASWQPLSGTWSSILNIGTAGLSGAAAGARLANAGLTSAVTGTTSRLWR